MGVFKKKSKYTRFQVYKEVTGTDAKPTFDIAQTGYGRIDNNLFIFMNIGIPGRAGIDYKNHYDERTEAVSWCAKKDTHSGQTQMQQIINGELNLYLFARWERDVVEWTYLGQGHVISFEDNVPVADPEGNDALCLEYQLTCRGVEEDIDQKQIDLGVLTLKDQKPRRKPRKKKKRTFKGRGSRDYLLKAEKDKKVGDLGEALVLEYEKNRLIDEEQKTLADSIEHISQTEGDGTGYDIKSFNLDGTVRFIEVKATKSGLNTEFFMSPNELEFSELNPQNYFLYRVYDLKVNPLSGSLYIHQGDISDGFDPKPTEFKMYSK